MPGSRLVSVLSSSIIISSCLISFSLRDGWRAGSFVVVLVVWERDGAQAVSPSHHDFLFSLLVLANLMVCHLPVSPLISFCLLSCNVGTGWYAACLRLSATLLLGNRMAVSVVTPFSCLVSHHNLFLVSLLSRTVRRRSA